MYSYGKKIREILTTNLDVIFVYTLGSIDDVNGELYKNIYCYELDDYIERVVCSFIYLAREKQFTLSIEKIMFILEYEMLSITYEKHPQENYDCMEELAATLLLVFVDKFNDR